MNLQYSIYIYIFVEGGNVFVEGGNVFVGGG